MVWGNKTLTFHFISIRVQKSSCIRIRVLVAHTKAVLTMPDSRSGGFRFCWMFSYFGFLISIGEKRLPSHQEWSRHKYRLLEAIIFIALCLHLHII